MDNMETDEKPSEIRVRATDEEENNLGEVTISETGAKQIHILKDFVEGSSERETVRDAFPVKIELRLLKTIVEFAEIQGELHGDRFNQDLVDKNDNFVKKLCAEISDDDVFKLLEASDFMGVDALFDILCKHFGKIFADLDVEQLRERFKVKPLTDQEQQELIKWMQEVWDTTKPPRATL